MHSRFLSALPVLLLAACAALPAQVMRASSDEVALTGSPQTNNVPYTLTRTSTIVQTLANGATITRTFTVKSARDTEGRTYSEEHLTLPGNPNRQPSGVVNYRIFDPVARTNIAWSSRTKIAYVTHIPVQAAEVDAARLPQTARAPTHVKREDLGVRTIAGIEARGTQITAVVPMGEVGNDQPFTIVTEEWMSMQYHIPLLTIRDDPRSGKRTDEVIDFQPGEPDPALFRIPEGYTVLERTAAESPLGTP